MELPGDKRIPHHLNPRNVINDFVYTIIISTAIAVFLTVTGFTTKSFLINFVMSQSFGIPIYATIHFLIWMLKPSKNSSFALIVMIGIGSGTLIGLQAGPFVL